MNLGIEYLIRTKVIKGLLKTPCSLFLTRWRTKSRLAVTIEDKDDFHLVKHWDLENCSYDIPNPQIYHVSKDDLFFSERIVIPNHTILSFKEELVPHRSNRYNKPMCHSLYSSYYKNVLNNELNKSRRKKWLWRCLHSPLNSQEIPSDYAFLNERELVQKHHPNKWNVWTFLVKNVLFNNVEVASELIFYEDYSFMFKNMLEDITTSSSSSFSF